MALTSPDNIETPEPGTQYNPIVAFQELANSVQEALNRRVEKGPDPTNVDIPNDINAGQDVKATRDMSAGRNLTVTGNTTSGRVRILNTTDLSPSSTGHGFQIGPDGGTNLGIDNNEIMARNKGSTSTLYLNNNGGNVTLGNSTSTVNIPGRVNSPNLPHAMASGEVAAKTVGSGAVTNVTVTFPAGRFSKAPHVTATLVGDARDVTTAVDSVTKSSFILRRGNIGLIQRVGLKAHWIAVQM